MTVCNTACILCPHSEPGRLHGPVGDADGQQAPADDDVAAEPVHGRLGHPVRGHHSGWSSWSSNSEALLAKCD